MRADAEVTTRILSETSPMVTDMVTDDEIAKMIEIAKITDCHRLSQTVRLRFTHFSDFAKLVLESLRS